MNDTLKIPSHITGTYGIIVKNTGIFCKIYRIYRNNRRINSDTLNLYSLILKGSSSKGVPEHLEKDLIEGLSDKNGPTELFHTREDKWASLVTATQLVLFPSSPEQSQ